jgi:phage shock protein A
MGTLDWVLEIVLIGLLLVTLLHALRLERALAVLRRDRTALGDAVAGFDQSARAAEQGIGKLNSLTGEAAQQVARKIEQASSLKDDLAFLAERGEHLADRLEAAVRAGRAMEGMRGTPAGDAPQRPRSSAERDLMHALRGTR